MTSQGADLPLIEPLDRAAWRAWLEKNHATSTGVWLAIGKKNTTASCLRYDDAVEEAVAFGWIDSTTYRLDAERFKQLFTPRKRGSQWSASNKARVERLLAAGLMTPAGLEKVEQAKADGSWTLLDDVEALVVPDDLEAALAQTPGARQGFDGLIASVRKQTLYWIATAKRPETRAARVEQTVRAAAEGRSPR